MPLVKEITTKGGKKMYITEISGKVYASFNIQAVDALLAGQDVTTKPGNGNWVFIDLPKGQAVASQAPVTVQAPAGTPPVVVSPTTSIVTNGAVTVLKSRLQQIVGELNELITSLG